MIGEYRPRTNYKDDLLWRSLTILNMVINLLNLNKTEECDENN